MLQHVSDITANDAACDNFTVAASGENSVSFAGGIIGRALDCDTLASNSLSSRQAGISATCANRSAVAGGFIGSAEDVGHMEQNTYKANGKITVSADASNGNSYAGATMGWASDSTVAGLNASLGGTVDVSSTAGSSAVAGGLVGKSSKANASECGVDVPGGASLSLASYGRSWGSAATGGLAGASSNDTLSRLHLTARAGSRLQFESKVDNQSADKTNTAAGSTGSANDSDTSNCYVNSASTSLALNSRIAYEQPYDAANVAAGFLGVSDNGCTLDSCFANGTLSSSSNHGLAGFAGYLQDTRHALPSSRARYSRTREATPTDSHAQTTATAPSRTAIARRPARPTISTDHGQVGSRLEQQLLLPQGPMGRQNRRDRARLRDDDGAIRRDGLDARVWLCERQPLPRAHDRQQRCPHRRRHISGRLKTMRTFFDRIIHSTRGETLVESIVAFAIIVVIMLAFAAFATLGQNLNRQAQDNVNDAMGTMQDTGITATVQLGDTTVASVDVKHTQDGSICSYTAQ